MSEQIDTILTQLDFPALKAVQARVQELVQQRREELRTKLEHDAQLIECSINDTNGHDKPKRRGRKPKDHHA